MTAARHQIKRYQIGFAAFFCLALAPGLSAPVFGGAPTELIVVDWHTGLAIGGYDPVAFYTEGMPVPGSADFELPYRGTVWRFANFGNREAFKANPDTYMPQFGGYDPLGVPGNVGVWLIAGGRLFLFYDRGRREAFAADAERILAAAERKWPDVASALTP